MHRLLTAVLLAAVAAGCPSPRLPKMRSPRICCASEKDVHRLDRAYVMVDGIYTSTFLSQRPDDDERRRARGEKPTFAGIKTDGGAFILLGIYHAPDGPRPPDEIERLDGRHVVVFGRLHEHTPSATAPQGAEMAVVSGPYVDEIERIEVR